MSSQIGFRFISPTLIAFYISFYYYCFVVFKMNDGGEWEIHMTFSLSQENIMVTVYKSVYI